MDRSVYFKELKGLKSTMKSVKNTPFTIYAKVTSLVVMNMRYEKVAFNAHLKDHPYILTRDIIRKAKEQFEAFMDISFVESPEKAIHTFKGEILEKKHRALWQEIWDRHNEREFREFIELKKNRLKINKLVPYIRGKDCVDFGCGNGSFAFAMLEAGARSVTGFDFGDKSVQYAKLAAKKLGYGNKAKFYIGNILTHPAGGHEFDFAVSNGVFHHLRKIQMPQAVRAVAGALRKGGWFWYYVDGKDAISMDLFDSSVEILKGVDLARIENIIKPMNIVRNKMVHLMDGMNATYIHSSYAGTIAMLQRSGFGNFRRLVGGAPTDFDHDRIAADRYGREKFGEGDLRILSQLVCVKA